MTNLYDLFQADLSALLTSWGEPKFRAGQIWSWLYEKPVTSFEAMTNLPKSLRERLQAETTLGCLTGVAEQIGHDGTIKRLYQLPDGQLIESVLMRYDENRRTACISTQAGCAMGCLFCATGQMGFGRNLTATEILEQALDYARELAGQGERLSNVVLMGMGEPFHNYEASLAAVRRLIGDLGIGARHITISTVGLVPEISRFALENLQVNLAISLHAATDKARSALIPINKRWPLADLMAACRYYIGQTGRRVTFEWALIRGQTDTVEQAHALGSLLKGTLCHVNLIPLNPTPGYKGKPSAIEAADEFVGILDQYGVSATVRVRRGLDIDAGCGQLKAKILETR